MPERLLLQLDVELFRANTCRHKAQQRGDTAAAAAARRSMWTILLYASALEDLLDS